MRACFVAALFVWITSEAAAPQPNILFIVADDQRPDTIHALGNEIIQTPNLDRLVTRGSVFSRAIAAYPICHVSQSRAAVRFALPAYPGGAIDPKLATLAPTFRKRLRDLLHRQDGTSTASRRRAATR